ncbi:hypothetical protein HGRIS_002604 [Hohenbuehelia grisea]|uniref:Protein kinase domain-containing protein n=1 Tax=Hohenbuehelia grisea TaxID=104357 RepID=A0ABR3JM48_9AGAR
MPRSSSTFFSNAPMSFQNTRSRDSSPLKSRTFHAQDDMDDVFLQSPYKSPVNLHHFYRSHTPRPEPIPVDDDDGAIFLASPSAAYPPFISSHAQPLRTPVKRPALSVRHINDASPSSEFNTSIGAGTKRKSTPLMTTPLRRHNLTPLNIQNPASGSTSLGRLAPLAPPSFVAKTPHTKAEMESYLKRQTATLTRLRITDLNKSGDEYSRGDDDSGIDIDADDDSTGISLFSANSSSLNQALARELLARKGKEKEEVAEAISPGGHITKRRARSRPVSQELLESVRHSPSPDIKQAFPSAAVPFPSTRAHRRNASTSSSSEVGSPIPRRRISAGPTRPPTMTTTHPPRPRPFLNRVESATLFFGPPIPAPEPSRSRLTSVSSSNVSTKLTAIRPKMMNRHSYAGPPQVWSTIQSRSDSPSPHSSPVSLPHQDSSMLTEDEDAFFGAASSSFSFNITESTPSPRSKKWETTSLPKKYKPRDSGIVVSSDDEERLRPGDISARSSLSAMPRTSSSASSIYSDPDDGLITPGVGPGLGSGWPDVGVRIRDSGEFGIPLNDVDVEANVDAFIMRTLAKASKAPDDGAKRVPGTPVKKIKTTFLNGDRPWQSAVASKVAALDFDYDDKKKGKAPRKSLPAIPLLHRSNKSPRASPADQLTDSDNDGEDSPSGRKERQKTGLYGALGLGRPSGPTGKGKGMSAIPRARWLMRRSSSGAFSSGGESVNVTPTRSQTRDWQLPPPRVPARFSPSRNALKLSPVRSTSSSSNSSVTTLNSPSARQLPISGSNRHSSSRPSLPLPNSTADRRRRQSGPHASPFFNSAQPGRFEREFVEVEEVGTGEFGKVIKVRRKASGDGGEVYAIKKSKQFEGVRHRLRLHEEVDILQHLSRIATVASGGMETRHPNVLGYVDSWEEDEALYIQTELCELGNLARFLWEYGRAFPRLDEARVWKILVDLSNGLRFIHDAGVIHLDIKPANIFMTGEGRFKIGDFGMASLWPRPNKQVEYGNIGAVAVDGAFEREGDKLYLAPEILQGTYGKAADVFSLGMTMLETATNIVVPDQGEAWHRLRQEDFSLVELEGSPELLMLLRDMMRAEPAQRVDIHWVWAHPVVARAREMMGRMVVEARRDGRPLLSASPLAGVSPGFLEAILGRGMDTSA